MLLQATIKLVDFALKVLQQLWPLELKTWGEEVVINAESDRAEVCASGNFESFQAIGTGNLRKLFRDKSSKLGDGA